MDSALSLDVSDHVRHRGFWWDRQKHVNMVRKQMPLFDLRFLLSRELTKNLAQRFPQLLKQEFASIFWDEKPHEICSPTSCGLASRTRPSVRFLSCEWLLTTEPDRGTPRNVKLLLPPRQSRGIYIEIVDITNPAQCAALRKRMGSLRFDLIFVNAGVTNDDRETLADVATEEFVRVMVTNALSPMRIVEAFQDLV